MISILAAFMIALVVSTCATPVVRRLAFAVGAVDSPAARRVQSRRIPRLGGIALILGFLTPMVCLFVMKTTAAQMFVGNPRLAAGVVAGSLVVAVVGVLDDVVGVRAKHKLLVQTGAALLAYAGGLRIDTIQLPLIGSISLGVFSVAVTIFWIVGIVNALNLIDGLDGLAAGVAFFACIANFVVAYLNQNWPMCIICGALAGSIIGFLFHNFNPATIFMGDSGSMFLGFILATTSVMTPQKGPTAVAILVPMLALGLPILDTLFAMVRRVLERRSIFSPDRGHIHHRLIDLGLTQRRAVLILYGACLLCTASAIGAYINRSWELGVALLILAIVVVGTVRVVAALTSSLAKHHQRTGQREPAVERLRRALPRTIGLLDGARGPGQVQTVLSDFASDAGLLAVEFGPDHSSAAIRTWRWEAAAVSTRTAREAVSVKFPIEGPTGAPYNVGFYWDSEKGEVNPQAEILLHVVADAVEGTFRVGVSDTRTLQQGVHVSTA